MTATRTSQLLSALEVANAAPLLGSGSPASLSAAAARIDDVPSGDLSETERWILSRVHHAVAETTRLLDGYLFGEYAHFLEQFVWTEFADAYIELSKPGLRDEARRAATVRTLAYVLDRVLRMLHPITPFITETLALQLWRAARHDETSLVIARWPTAGRREPTLESTMEIALEVVRAVRALRQDAGIDPAERVRVALSGQTAPVAGSLGVIAALANADAAVEPGSGPARIVRAVEVRVEAKRDAAADRARIARELDAAREALRRSEELLAKPGFADRAPKAVVDKERARLEERRSQARLLEEEMSRLG